MSVTVDANLLLYASDRASRFYDPATVTLRRLAQGPRLLYLFWPVIMAYLRIATHSAIFDSPLAPDEATGNIDSLLKLPHVRSPSEDEIFWTTYMDVTAPGPVRGNLVPDAHIAALMRRHGVRDIFTLDRDFRRFEGIRTLDPL